MRFTISKFAMPVIVLAASSLGWAQDTSSAPAQASDNATETATSNVTTEPPVPEHQFTPGSGAQPLGFGIGGRKQLDIGLSFTQSWDSNAGTTVAGSNWEPATSFGGSLQLTRETRTNRTLLNYSGNGIAYVNRNPSWTTYQNFGFSQNFKVGRWGFAVADNLNYTPNSPYGGYGEALATPDTDGNSSVLKPQYVPNQSILTPTTSSYFNSVLGQVEYGISRRSSWTASGAYGFLRYPNADFHNTNQITASTGYNYSISARNAISLTYSYNQFKYTQIASDFTTQNVQFGFSHILAGRFSLQASGGVEFIDSSNLGQSQKSAQFSGTGTLDYSRAHTSLGLSYFAGSTGGSGVLTGASTQDVRFRIGQQFGRKWSGSASVGYSHNGGLFEQQSYDTLFASPGIRRALTRNMGLSFNYTYQRQLTNSTCTTASCGSLSRNFLTVGIDYKFRPIPLE